MNPQTAPEPNRLRWSQLWSTAQSIINRHQTNEFGGLVPDYQAVFCGNNDMFAPGGSLAGTLNEILWTVPQEYKLTESYGATTFLIAAAVTGYTDDAKKGYTNSLNYGLNAQWAGMHAREQFSLLFGFNGSGVSEDKRTTMWATDNMGHHISNTDFAAFTDGYLPLKFSNLLANADGSFPHFTYEVAPGHTMERFGDPNLNKNRYKTTNNFADTDYPMIRLADVYLMAAEATLHGAGNKQEALTYMNNVRTRAGLPPYTSVASINDENVLNERARELYWENCRRTDLIRFNKYCYGYTWSWKGGTANGGDLPEYMKLFPIPSNVLSAQSSFKQNPGY